MKSFLAAVLAAVPTIMILGDYLYYHEIKWWLFVLWVVIMAFAIATAMTTDAERKHRD